MSALPLIPDVVRIMSAFLRTVDDVVALVGQRVYTAFPKQIGDEPFVLVQRVGGEPAVARPLVVELAQVQLDAYGGPQALAYELVATCRYVLSEWSGEQPDASGNVCSCVVGANRYVPDETWKPPRPRYVTDLEVVVKPAGVVLAGAI